MALGGHVDRVLEVSHDFEGARSATDESASPIVLSILEASALVGDRDAARALSLRVVPYTRELSALTAGSIGRPLGDAAMLLEKPDEARDYYHRAIEVCEKVRFRPELALTRLSLAELLLDHYPDEHDTAMEHLDFAIAEFREMKMQPALERALRRRGLLKA